MRGTFYLLGVALITCGILTALGTSLTGGAFMPGLWMAALGVLVSAITSLTDVGDAEPESSRLDRADGVGR